MPFLRVIRDKRGYETTYLMHWYREGSRQRSKILYVFRTPGGVRVGRDPLSADVQKQIEARHPDIEFDWNAVRDNQQVIEPAPELRRPRRPKREEAPAAPAPVPAAAPAPPPPASEAPQPPAQPPRPSIPSAILGATPDEQIAFLTEWYGVVRERIPQRVSDPVRREALFALAERMNPAAWTDADQIATGLQSAAEALERLSRVFSKRRRRTRKRRPGGSEAATASSEPASGESMPESTADDSSPDDSPDD